MAMASSKLLFFLSAILMLIAQAIALPANYLYGDCVDEKGNYTADSNYATNLKLALPSLLTSNSTTYGYYKYDSSFGRDADKVYVIGLCRGDVLLDPCHSCLNFSTYNLAQKCPNQKEAIEFSEECMLRYSNRYIFGSIEDAPHFYAHRTDENAYPLDKDVNKFKEVRKTLLNNLRSQATENSPLFMFATGNASFNSSSQQIFELVQCTPDLSKKNCDKCLVSAIEQIRDCCDANLGGKVSTPSCNLRFEIDKFYESAAYSVPPPTKGTRTVIIIVVPIVAVVVLVISIIIYRNLMKGKGKGGKEELPKEGS